jgi:hypothetical protein
MVFSVGDKTLALVAEGRKPRKIHNLPPKNERQSSTPKDEA